VERILVAGSDSVAGGNFAAAWSSGATVSGAAWSRPVDIADVQSLGLAPTTAAAVEQLVREQRPDRIVCCGPVADSCWNAAETRLAAPERFAAWAAVAHKLGLPFTYLSSDAVFTGPWLFHREQGSCYCNSHGARLLRTAESLVAEACPKALIVRSHVFGWSPQGPQGDALETMLESLRAGESVARDYFRHATPILATDLANLLPACWAANLEGLFHIAGAERVNPFRFACLVADEFRVAMSCIEPLEVSIDARKAFGGGETSLQTRKVRKLVDLSVPLLREGLARLREQMESGYRDRFQVTDVSTERVLERAA
jgi:dTDP-4-dehydrorhamnose reductase